MLVIHTTVFPDIPPDRGGGFQINTFDHLLHHQVHLPGLDRTWEHTLIDAQVADDRAHAVLTLHSVPKAALSLDRNLRIVTWQPAAHVRAHDTDGNVICETKLDAPLQPGHLVEVGGETYRVAPATFDVLWPHRDPGTGICRGTIDWQHVTLNPEPQAPHQPTPAH